MLQVVDNTNNINSIINVLVNKNRRAFKNMGSYLKKQALYFTPAYRDFILKILKNNSLKIKHEYRGGYISRNGEESNTNKLSKRQSNTIVTDVHDVDVLPHELGHAIDFWFGHKNSLSRTIIISNGQTLYDIFTEEFESKQEELYKLVMDEYKNIINSNINKKAYDTLLSNIDLYRYLLRIPCNKKDKEALKKRKRIQKKLYESGFVEVYYQLYKRKCYAILNSKYSPILDALSSIYDFNGLCLNHHDNDYYCYDKYLAVQEFFANVFAAKVTSKHVYFDNLIKYLPKSFDAFERLFVLFYDRIMNNKRFNDIEIRKDN